ncbi:MAG: universal stress protein [Betaproteobacteria bacterium]
MYEKLLIPLDGSRAAESVLSFVEVLQSGVHVPMELVSAVDVSVLTTQRLDEARYLDQLIAEAERGFTEYLRAIATKFKNFQVTYAVERGKPAEIIIRRAAAAASTLILMATHGRSGLSRWLLGSVAEKVLRATSNPLFLGRSAEQNSGDDRVPVRSIIVPLDGSPLAESVLNPAMEMAQRFQAEIVLLQAYELPAAAYYGRENYLPNYDELKTQGQSNVRGYLDEKAEFVRAEGVRNVRTIVADGLAADQIVQCAERIPHSLLAMCTHGRTGLQRWTVGSVTEKVVRHSRRPVLVVRAR